MKLVAESGLLIDCGVSLSMDFFNAVEASVTVFCLWFLASLSMTKVNAWFLNHCPLYGGAFLSRGPN